MARTPLWGRRAVAAGVCLAAMASLTLAPYLVSSSEQVRLRNALLLEPVQPQGFDWQPDTVPPDFALETLAPDPAFVEAARQLGVFGMESDWERALAISGHLLRNPHLVGTPIQSRLWGTYRGILDEGRGYCGDFTRVFMALALASGLSVRAWSFSLDGFGGHGHIFPEVWNRQRKQWQLLDVFNNFYAVSGAGVPLSALEFRNALAQSSASLRLLPLAPTARAGYAVQERALDYYRSGLSEWYMSWGNNVFSYDRAFLVAALSPLSRALEQLGAIAQGVYPRIHILADASSQAQVKALMRLRRHLVWVGMADVLALLLVMGGAVAWLGGLRAQGRVAA
ncbi:MAG: transglutaminase domain-containing protein [Burkholderiales bacterium]